MNNNIEMYDREMRSIEQQIENNKMLMSIHKANTKNPIELNKKIDPIKAENKRLNGQYQIYINAINNLMIAEEQTSWGYLI